MKLKQEIKISTLAIDEGDDTIHYQLEVSNGINLITQDFYGYADNFKEFANGLLSFPKTVADKVKYELGEIGERWAYYVLLDVFCYENKGCKHPLKQVQVKVESPKLEQDEEDEIFRGSDRSDAARA